MVKIFRFPLQKVLDVRQTIENSKAIALSRSQIQLSSDKAKLKNLNTKKDTYLDSGTNSNSMHLALSLNDLKISTDYINQLNNMIQNQTGEVEKSNQIVDKDRNVLIEASRDKKVVEKLKEHHLERYVKDNRSRSIKQESEIALQVTQKNKQDGTD